MIGIIKIFPRIVVYPKGRQYSRLGGRFFLSRDPGDPKTDTL